MIVGIGNDIIEKSRIRKACEKDAFLVRVFTEKERQMIQEHPDKAAGCWAVKESVVKVFGTGFGKVQPIDIEVLRDEKGAPYVNLLGAAAEEAKKSGVLRIHVSISHTGDLVSAIAIGEGRCQDETTG